MEKRGIIVIGLLLGALGMLAVGGYELFEETEE